MGQPVILQVYYLGFEMAEKTLIDKMVELSVVDDLLLCSYTKAKVKVNKTGLQVQSTEKISKKRNSAHTVFGGLMSFVKKISKFRDSAFDKTGF